MVTRRKTATRSLVVITMADGTSETMPRDEWEYLKAGFNQAAGVGTDTAPARLPKRSETRGKKLNMVFAFKDGDEQMPLAEARLKQLLEAGWMYYKCESPQLRELGLAKMRKAAEAWALHDRDRQNQHGRRDGKPASADRVETHGKYTAADLRARCSELEAAGVNSATGTTAREFGVSRRTVQRAKTKTP